jgi:hypothetical protein
MPSSIAPMSASPSTSGSVRGALRQRHPDDRRRCNFAQAREPSFTPPEHRNNWVAECSTDIRQMSGGFEARIALLIDLSNGQQRSSRARGLQTRRLTTLQR